MNKDEFFNSTLCTLIDKEHIERGVTAIVRDFLDWYKDVYKDVTTSTTDRIAYEIKGRIDKEGAGMTFERIAGLHSRLIRCGMQPSAADLNALYYLENSDLVETLSKGARDFADARRKVKALAALSEERDMKGRESDLCIAVAAYLREKHGTKSVLAWDLGLSQDIKEKYPMPQPSFRPPILNGPVVRGATVLPTPDTLPKVVFNNGLGGIEGNAYVDKVQPDGTTKRRRLGRLEVRYDQDRGHAYYHLKRAKEGPQAHFLGYVNGMTRVKLTNRLFKIYQEGEIDRQDELKEAKKTYSASDYPPHRLRHEEGNNAPVYRIDNEGVAVEPVGTLATCQPRDTAYLIFKDAATGFDTLLGRKDKLKGALDINTAISQTIARRMA